MALRGIKVIELAGLAPGPFCGMILADFGATVIRIDKVGPSLDIDCLANGKQSIALNLKHKRGVEIFRKLCKTSDVLIDTYRSGVMESLGLGPSVLLAENQQLIYARLTGYGQSGRFAQRAGHDINYLSLTGLLSMFRQPNTKPFPPVNLLADFGGGGLMCAFGITMALLERIQSGKGKGQIIDCSMVEGASYLGSWVYRSQSLPIWGNPPGENILDGGVHFYQTYETKDNKYMAVGALESQFYAKLLKGLDLTEDECPQFNDFAKSKQIFTKKFLEKTQQEWCDVFDNIDACVTPVLSLEEAGLHPHNVDRNSFLSCDSELKIPRPSPKISGSSANSQAFKPKISKGEHTELILQELKYSGSDIAELRKDGVIEINKGSKL